MQPTGGTAEPSLGGYKGSPALGSEEGDTYGPNEAVSLGPRETPIPLDGTLSISYPLCLLSDSYR